MSRKRAILRWLRGGAAVLILAALVWLGYRRGHRDGYAAATPPTSASSGQLKIVTYAVADLVYPIGSDTPTAAPPGPGSYPQPGADFDPLIDLIVSTIDSETWQENGTGEGEIMSFPSNLSLVVSQTRQVHEQIADLLQQLRTLSVTVAAREIIPVIQSQAAYRNEGTSHVLRVLPRETRGAAAMARLFHEAVENLEAVWGAPDFRGAPDDEASLAWVKAQEIAVWPRAGGQAYVAVQNEFEGQTQLVAGWRSGE
jgi:hypothetical protein